jgi:hypothetical protein
MCRCSDIRFMSASGHPRIMQQVTLVPGCVQEHSVLVSTEVKIKITFHNLELHCYQYHVR